MHLVEVVVRPPHQLQVGAVGLLLTTHPVQVSAVQSGLGSVHHALGNQRQPQEPDDDPLCSVLTHPHTSLIHRTYFSNVRFSVPSTHSPGAEFTSNTQGFVPSLF